MRGYGRRHGSFSCALVSWSRYGGAERSRRRGRHRLTFRLPSSGAQTLDVRTTAPAAAGGAIDGHGTGLLVEDVSAEEGASEPEAGADEGKCLIGPPLVTEATTVEAAPAKGSAAVCVVDVLDESAKGSEPGQGENKVEWIVKEGSGEGNHPDQGGDEGHGGDDNGVDCATIGKIPFSIVVPVDEVGGNAKADRGGDELAEAKEDGDQTGENHCVRSGAIGSLGMGRWR